MSNPRDPRGLPPEFDPRRGEGRGRPPGNGGPGPSDGRRPAGPPPRNGGQPPRSGGQPPRSGNYGPDGYGPPRGDTPRGPDGYGRDGYGSARQGGDDSRGRGPGGTGPRSDPRGVPARRGAGLPPELDPRGRRAGDYAPYGLSGYEPEPGPYGPPAGDRKDRRQHPALAAAKVAAAFLSVLVLVASGVLWVLYKDFTGNVDRVDAIGSTADDVDGEDMNLLLVGSDDRTKATPAELAELSTTTVASNATDTMMLVHVPADGRKATAISFPRDSWVEIPGHGTHKLNSAYVRGAGTGSGRNEDKGRQLLVQTISELAGLKIDHYVEVDLLGFYRITKAIGGVEVCLTKAQKEKDSGIDLPAGKSTIEGKQALSFVRQRKGLPRGDLDRIVRQQYFLGATFRKVTSLGVLTNPIKLKRLLDAVGSSLRMDADLDPLQLAQQVRGLAAGNVEFRTIPTDGLGTRDGQSVVLVDEAALPAFFASVIDPPKPKPAVKPAARGDTTISVFNGSGRSGLAGTTATALTKAGFTVSATANADRRDYTKTEIRYEPAAENQARAVLAVLPSAKLVPRDGVGAGVQLVLGSDYTGLKGSAPAGGAATSAAPAPAPSGDARTADDTSCIN